METKHTPGPWYAPPLSITVRAKGCVVAQVITQPNGIGEANAALIAAAPDLLAALDALVSTFDAGNDPVANAWENARDAIAKARGEVQS